MLKVLFAPDWRKGNPYQSHLAEAMEGKGVEVEFYSGRHVIAPFSRAIAKYRPNILHLHWPEAYFTLFGRPSAPFLMQFCPDLAHATRDIPLVFTAHNLTMHRYPNLPAVRSKYAFVLNRASAIFAHSKNAALLITQYYGVNGTKITHIPHGDLSAGMGELPPQDEARRALGIRPGPLCLVFGAVAPYKGIEGLIDFWKKRRPRATLAIVGKPLSTIYACNISRHVAGIPSVITDLRWLSENELKLWLGAANCALFNYSDILSSGSMNLALAYGIPVVFPKRLMPIDINGSEAAAYKFDKLDTDFMPILDKALATPKDFDRARSWRESASWEVVAKITTDTYNNLSSANFKVSACQGISIKT